MARSTHLLIERVIQGRAPLARGVVEAILEVAYLAMRADKHLAEEEVDVFARVAGALLAPPPAQHYRAQADHHRAAPPLDTKEVNRWLDRFAGPAERLAALAALLTDSLARSLAYQIACLIAISDLDASDGEDQFDRDLVEALGLSEEDAALLAGEVHDAVDE
jgi:hypothetical protein